MTHRGFKGLRRNAEAAADSASASRNGRSALVADLAVDTMVLCVALSEVGVDLGLI